MGMRRLTCLLALGSVALVPAACGGSDSANDEGALAELVVRWYRDADPAICDRLTDRLLESGWGEAGDPGRQECRATVAAADPLEGVEVEDVSVDRDAAEVVVGYTADGESRSDRLRFVRTTTGWQIDGVGRER
jgi:hypothetical protein